MSRRGGARYAGLSRWLGANPVWAVVIFVGLNLIGVLLGEVVGGGFAGTAVRGVFLAAAIAVGIAFLNGRWERRQ